MKRVRMIISIFLCIFLLTGCAEMNEISTSNEPDEGAVETEAEVQTNNTSNKDKKANKKKNKKSKKSKNEDNADKKEQKVTGEYSTDSDAVADAKNSVSGDFYRLYQCYEDEDEEEVEVEVTYGEALNHYFDATVWRDVENDDFEGVEFIGTKYEGNDTWKYHLYYSYDGGFLDSWLGGGWLREYVIYKNGKKVTDLQNPHDTLVMKAYCQYLEDKGYVCEEVG